MQSDIDQLQFERDLASQELKQKHTSREDDAGSDKYAALKE